MMFNTEIFPALLSLSLSLSTDIRWAMPWLKRYAFKILIIVSSMTWSPPQKTTRSRISSGAWWNQITFTWNFAFSDSFSLQNGQTCDNMIVYCRFGGKEVRCTDFYREVLMDEGICCAFNILHPSYLYKGQWVISHLIISKAQNSFKICFLFFSYIFVRDFTSSIGTIPVDWNLETGYADKLPLYYYPRTAVGKN